MSGESRGARCTRRPLTRPGVTVEIPVRVVALVAGGTVTYDEPRRGGHRRGRVKPLAWAGVPCAAMARG